jgi:hypothetical protein
VPAIPAVWFGSSPSCLRWAAGCRVRACRRAGCRIDLQHPIQLPIEALAECPSLPLGWKTGTAALR